ncbi:uncharacterized protein BDZ99DRAFT_479285 [Mytilinidion resinicola]|uniref:Uncharacterized protein n=1 Tax=Mytilinidion resinicola TaxID=574789 RepID=A0A6A6YDV3_9PEZI|nr:uncharacterized protein BDZ99DRAFT_479285 [Mytilinidion resinicola]KAF2806910.1 hypothetical protein BDZ99DRAFT_479285 [Mytilinidion resinicola]
MSTELIPHRNTSSSGRPASTDSTSLHINPPRRTHFSFSGRFLNPSSPPVSLQEVRVDTNLLAQPPPTFQSVHAPPAVLYDSLKALTAAREPSNGAHEARTTGCQTDEETSEARVIMLSKIQSSLHCCGCQRRFVESSGSMPAVEIIYTSPTRARRTIEPSARAPPTSSSTLLTRTRRIMRASAEL